jgi:hypothetical protein
MIDSRNGSDRIEEAADGYGVTWTARTGQFAIFELDIEQNRV